MPAVLGIEPARARSGGALVATALATLAGVGLGSRMGGLPVRAILFQLEAGTFQCSLSGAAATTGSDGLTDR